MKHWIQSQHHRGKKDLSFPNPNTQPSVQSPFCRTQPSADQLSVPCFLSTDPESLPRSLILSRLTLHVGLTDYRNEQGWVLGAYTNKLSTERLRWENQEFKVNFVFFLEGGVLRDRVSL